MEEKTNIEDAIAKQGFFINIIVGRSMYPMLRNRRDIIVVKPYEGRLKKYDIPLYKVEDNYILHRIIKVLPDSYIIRGDNCYQKEYGITDDMILGVLTEFHRDSKIIDMNGIKYKLYVRIWHFLYPARYVYKKFRILGGKIKAKIRAYFCEK